MCSKPGDDYYRSGPSSSAISISLRRSVLIAAVLGSILFCTTASGAPPVEVAAPPATESDTPPPATVSCAWKHGERAQWPADTSRAWLIRSTGFGECLLGKTWRYDPTNVWVSDDPIHEQYQHGGDHRGHESGHVFRKNGRGGIPRREL